MIEKVYGIDPGFTGAIAMVSLVSNAVTVCDLPVEHVRNSSGKLRGQYIEAAVYDLLKHDVPENVRVFLERQGSMPDQSAQSVFATGQGFGFFRGILVGLQLPYELVHPIVWKKGMGVTSDKNTSLAKARALFPTCDLGHRKDADRAEALLIAEYGRRLLTGSNQQANMKT